MKIYIVASFRDFGITDENITKTDFNPLKKQKQKTQNNDSLIGFRLNSQRSEIKNCQALNKISNEFKFSIKNKRFRE